MLKYSLIPLFPLIPKGKKTYKIGEKEYKIKKQIITKPLNKVLCNKHIIGGIRETDVKEFTQITNTDPRITKYKHETITLNKLMNMICISII
jgi:hypothetical protein